MMGGDNLFVTNTESPMTAKYRLYIHRKSIKSVAHVIYYLFLLANQLKDLMLFAKLSQQEVVHCAKNSSVLSRQVGCVKERRERACLSTYGQLFLWFFRDKHHPWLRTLVLHRCKKKKK
jgi:hypothetical protein